MKPNKASSTPPSDVTLYEDIHQGDLDSGDVIELGPTVPGQGSLFERIRAGITHGEVLARTFDIAVTKRCNITRYGRDETPKIVDEATFDADVERIKSFTSAELEDFDLELCWARGESRHPSGGVVVSRSVGFGPEVFGIAYDGISSKWSMTNEFGLHGHCDSHLRMSLEFDSEVGRDGLKTAIISGFIFQLPSFQTPIMTAYGWPFLPPEFLKKALEELWLWKMFIIVHDGEIAPKKHCWGKELFTPEVALRAQKEF
ncbi:MAG: hypothetical protein KBB54_03720 [Candidatus Pacebacteria bacterium]|nr:hypothetical protein [Candidatus Paceibacterota bacterium]MBP9818910.1 hypothetical protein [Candidatus Paceibacterota bacterium]